MAQPVQALDIFRYHPEQAGEPAFQRYEVPYRDDWVVLDAINHIKDHLDGTLSYRWSCRMGVCGSCGMMINGVPRLSCATFLKEFYPRPVRVEPLAHFPVHRDLVIEIEDFMDKLSRISPWIVREDLPPAAGELRQTPVELDRYKQFSMCINCMLCYAACPVYGLRPVFLGPAAIALAQRYNLDSRDQGQAGREAVLTSEEGGIWDCTLVGECTTVCPAHVDPAAAIQQAKLRGALRWAKDVLLPWGRS